jgi:hypothetical protein
MPSDTVWTGVITGVVGLGGILATGLTALRLDRRRAHADHERVREQHDNEQRKDRGGAYYERSSS